MNQNQAEPMYRRALENYGKSLGTDHPDVAGSRNNLAALYNNQGKTAKAASAKLNPLNSGWVFLPI
jgi:hypothetical protein